MHLQEIYLPGCAVTGQAARTAAAMTDDFGILDISKLQKKLVETSVVLHENEIMRSMLRAA